jgi:hypothetical protein
MIGSFMDDAPVRVMIEVGTVGFLKGQVGSARTKCAR